MGLSPSPTPTSAPCALPAGVVHVWSGTLDVPSDERDRLAGTLSADERSRAARFRFDRDRDRFLVGRGLVRTVVAQYLQLSPEELAFRYGPRGKPALAEAEADSRHFNLAHSGGMAVLALGRSALGVDVERVRPMGDADAIAEHFFSADERAALRGTAAEGKSRAFFECWVRKEAYLKATGDGLAKPLDEFDVSPREGTPVGLRWVAGLPDEPARWWLGDLEVAPDHAAALAVEGRPEWIEPRSFQDLFPAERA